MFSGLPKNGSIPQDAAKAKQRMTIVGEELGGVSEWTDYINSPDADAIVKRTNPTLVQEAA